MKSSKTEKNFVREYKKHIVPEYCFYNAGIKQPEIITGDNRHGTPETSYRPEFNHMLKTCENDRIELAARSNVEMTEEGVKRKSTKYSSKRKK